MTVNRDNNVGVDVGVGGARRQNTVNVNEVVVGAQKIVAGAVEALLGGGAATVHPRPLVLSGEGRQCATVGSQVNIGPAVDLAGA